MANKYEVIFKIAAQLQKGFSSTFASATTSISRLEKQSQELNEAVSDIGGLLKLREQTKALSAEFFKQKSVVENLSNAIARTKQPSNEMIAALVTEERKLKKVQIAFEKNMASLKEANLQSKVYGSSVKELANKHAFLSSKLKDVQQNMQKLQQISNRRAELTNAQFKVGDAAMQSAVAITTMGRATVNALSSPVRAAMEMQDAMADIAKVVDFEDPKGLSNMQRALEKMSLELPMSAVGLAQIAAAAGQAGIAGDELVQFTEQAAKMGVAFDISAQEAGEMMAKWRASMGLTQQQALDLANATNALSNSNAAQAKQIGEVLKRYGALGKVAGLTEKQTAAFAATAIGAGAEAEVAATGINAFMRAMVRGGGMTDLQSAAFTNIGFDPKQLQKDVQNNAPKAILNVLEAIKVKVPKELQSQYLTAMFGEEGARAIGPLIVNTERLKSNFALVAQSESYAGSMLREFEARVGTTSNSLVVAQNAISFISGALGAPLLEPIKECALAFAKAAAVAGDWMGDHQELVGVVTKVGIGLGALGIAFHVVRAATLFAVMPVIALQKGLLALQAKLISSKLATVAWASTCSIASKSAAVLAMGVKGVGTALRFAMLNPVGLAITGISALAAAGVYLYKNWDTCKQKIGEFGEAIGSVFSAAEELAKAPVNSLIGMINKVISGLNSMASFKLPKWFGGKSFGVQIPEVPQLASGGIVRSPTMAMIGEGGESEAVLPLSKLASLLGSRASQAHGDGSGMVINFSPTIQVSGSGADVYDGVKRALNEGQKDLKRELERLIANERRLSFT